MRPTVRLGRVASVPIGLHWSILLIAVMVVSGLAGTILPSIAPGYGSAPYLIAALFGGVAFLASIAAHELGHAVVARREQVPVRGITLFALGGVASMGSEASTPGGAARIAAAGPAVSVGLAIAGAGAAYGLATLGSPALLVAAVAWLAVVNGVLALFNLLPALPLDGGRILQALLWHRSGDRHRATISAARVGRLGGWAIVLFGLWELTRGGAGLWTMMIGAFVILAARSEEMRARFSRWSRANGLGGQRNAWTYVGRMGPRPGPAPQPGPGPHRPGPVIDVDWREAPPTSPPAPQPAEVNQVAGTAVPPR
ncbi:MAG: site-2 protease family protein [Acidimicrobiales bacterium]